MYCFFMSDSFTDELGVSTSNFGFPSPWCMLARVLLKTSFSILNCSWYSYSFISLPGDDWAYFLPLALASIIGLRKGL